MSQRQPRDRKVPEPGFTLIEVHRPSDDRIAEAILYLLTRRAQRLAQAQQDPSRGDLDPPSDSARRGPRGPPHEGIPRG